MARAGPLDGDAAALRRAGHLLNRAAFGPTLAELERVLESGTTAWIEQQLHPESIDESSNDALNRRIARLMERVVASEDRHLVRRGEIWRYRKGNGAPPRRWNARDFDDADWSAGQSGFGYGDEDDRTVLEDMRGEYGSIFIRRSFDVPAERLAALNDLVLRIRYDDGFVAFLNGVEVARRNIAGKPGTPVSHRAFAMEPHEAEGFEEIDITSRKSLLRPGGNVVALQVHNRSLDSSDLTAIPELVDRKVIPGTERLEIKGLEELKALAHIHAVYSRRQLQNVLALFWENHFTTDARKVASYLDELKNSDASDALSEAEAVKLAARLEHREFEFFREHALGNFGDLLRASARSPTMLIYLDNVLNVLGNANENYAREILELHTFGADNGYDQVDIEQLSKCFTGWGVAKCTLETAADPHGPHGVQVVDSVLVAPGDRTEASAANWRYFKGTRSPPSDWAEPGFDDARWMSGPGGFGYGDDDDATVLDDMRQRYTTVYLRKTFRVADPGKLKSLMLRIDFDDGFVAYLNGHEAARVNAPGKPGEPVGHRARATANHEAGEPETFNLDVVRDRVVAGENVLAIHVLNVSPTSSDLSSTASLIDRETLPGSIENGDPNGVIAFRFLPEAHNATEAKTLFRDSKHRIELDGRAGTRGLEEAERAIERILEHPSTPIFVCSKLIQRLVGDEIDFRHPDEGPWADLLDRCVEAWSSTEPKGDIRRVVKTILTSPEFWSERAYRAKVKDPFEYVSSTLRALDGETSGLDLPESLASMGMELFTREDPDGWPEVGSEWVDTSSFQSRIVFAQALTERGPGSNEGSAWDARRFLERHGLESADDIVGFFESLFFQGTLRDSDRQLVKTFLTTDAANRPVPLSRERSDYLRRVRNTLGYMLSLPDWHFQ